MILFAELPDLIEKYFAIVKLISYFVAKQRQIFQSTCVYCSYPNYASLVDRKILDIVDYLRKLKLFYSN